jgi:hypothetical protein
MATAEEPSKVAAASVETEEAYYGGEYEPKYEPKYGDKEPEYYPEPKYGKEPEYYEKKGYGSSKVGHADCQALSCSIKASVYSGLRPAHTNSAACLVPRRLNVLRHQSLSVNASCRTKAVQMKGPTILCSGTHRTLLTCMHVLFLQVSVKLYEKFRSHLRPQPGNEHTFQFT